MDNKTAVHTDPTISTGGELHHVDDRMSHVTMVETSAATIKLSVGVAGSSSDSDSEPDLSDNRLVINAQTSDSLLKGTTVGAGVSHTTGERGSPDQASGVCTCKLDHCPSCNSNRRIRASKGTNLQDATPQIMPVMPPENQALNLSSVHQRDNLLDSRQHEQNKKHQVEKITETPRDPNYERKLAEMRSKRFNPFDKDPFDVPDNPFTHEQTGMSTDLCSPVKSVQSLSGSGSFSETSDTESSPKHIVDSQEDQLGITEDHFSLSEVKCGLLKQEDMKVPTVEELEFAIEECKQQVVEAGSQTPELRDLVRKLVRLRLKLTEAKEGSKETDSDIKVVVGHQFVENKSNSSKHYCEKCSSVIWGLIQGWYQCQACGFCCHERCLNMITRTCASVKVNIDPTYIYAICPEKGLAVQNYKCAECKAAISYQSGFGEPRQCDYTGAFYCDMCHWNDTIVIPARILHNWDFEHRKVCRASKQFLKLMLLKPVIRIQDINPMLFNFVEELNEVRKLREEILVMKKYFLSCKGALGSKLLLQLQERQHFVENSDMYSLLDLCEVTSDVLLPKLAKIHSSFAQHIKTDCQLCQGKGYICELCDDREVLFPFDNIALVCSKCSTVLHRHCYFRVNQKCPKCERLLRRSVEERHDEKTN